LLFVCDETIEVLGVSSDSVFGSILPSDELIVLQMNVVTFASCLAVVGILVEFLNFDVNDVACIDDFVVNTHKHGVPLSFKVDDELIIDFLSAFSASVTDVG
jgi:hypothetical protein